MALVIGNGAYQTIGKLKNPANDARAMAAELQKLGFEVTSATDADQRTIKRLVREFGEKLRTTGAAGLFYYAGHGVQLNSKNYLIPVEIDVASEADVEDQAVNVQYVLDWMNAAQNGLNIVILDACRNNPFTRSIRSAADGLAQVDAPTGTLIAYATAPGRVASDGAGENGLYTEELLKQMRVAGLNEGDLFKNVRAAVVRKTKGTKNEQVPWEASSLIGTFYFNPVAAAVRPTPIPVTPTTSAQLPDLAVVTERGAKEAEREAWGLIYSSTDAQDFRDFRATYPNGTYFGQAGIRLEQLVWEQTRNSNDKAKLRAYLAEFKNGPNAGTAQLLLNRLERVSQPAPVTAAPGPSAPAAPVAGTVREQKLGRGVVMNFAWIPKGNFQMGSENGDDDEKPVHLVTISKGYWMATTEVTQGQWEAIMGTTVKQQRDKADASYKIYGEGANYPMYYVSWEEAQEFVKRMNARGDGYTYRLPSEAEWEYAARAGSTGDYAGPLAEMAWYSDNSGGGAHPVGTKKANAWGLYDMHGNVWEWVQDWYGSYGSLGVTDPRGPTSGVYRVYRGGGWYATARNVRSAYRNNGAPANRLLDVGFRLVRE